MLNVIEEARTSTNQKKAPEGADYKSLMVAGTRFTRYLRCSTTQLVAAAAGLMKTQGYYSELFGAFA